MTPEPRWWPLIGALWAYFYTTDIKVDTKGPHEPSIKWPRGGMLVANGLRSGVCIGPLIIAYEHMPPLLDVSRDPWDAFLVGLALGTLLEPLGILTNEPDSEDAGSLLRFAGKWILSRIDVTLKLGTVAAIVWVIQRFVNSLSTRTMYAWGERHFAFVLPIRGHLELPVLVFVVGIMTALVKSSLWRSRPRWGGTLSLVTLGSVGTALLFAFNLSLVTLGLPNTDWETPGLGILSALIVSMLVSYFWVRWDAGLGDHD